MKSVVVLWLVLVGVCFSQTNKTGNANTKGNCSPAVTGHNNQLTVSCPGVSDKQLLAILQTIKRNQLNPDAVLKALNEIKVSISEMSSMLPKNAGELFPANEPDPPNTCPTTVPPDAFKVFLGNFVVFTEGKAEPNVPYNAVVLAGEPLVTLEKSSSDTLIIGATVRSPDDRVIVQIKSGKFFVNPNNSFRSESDPSSVTVYDQNGDVALSVKYVNTHSAVITGTFMHHGKGFTVKEGVVHFTANKLSVAFAGGCTSGSFPGTAFKVN